MLADLILDFLGNIAAKRYRAVRRIFRIAVLAFICMIAYGIMQGPVA